MVKVVNQWETSEDFKGSTEYGVTECCGVEVERSVYGGDEECPCCGALLDWD
jgi:hypothetical protein